MNALFIACQIVISAALFYSGFCRLCKTNVFTIREVRWALWFESVAAGLVFMAPMLPLAMPELDWVAWSTPDWVWIYMLLAATLVQIVRARYWVDGVRDEFQRGS